MSHIFEELPQQHESLDGLWSGTIAKGAADMDDYVEVLISSFGTDHRFGPCRWMTRGSTLPQRGDECQIMFDDQQRPFVMWFAPSDSDFVYTIPDGSVTIPKLSFDPATQAELNTHASSDVMDGDTAGGDLSGTYPNPYVDGILGATTIDPFTDASGGRTAAFTLPGGDAIRYIRNNTGDASNRRVWLFAFSRDPLNWAAGSPIEITVRTVYYQGGGYTRSVAHGAWITPLSLKLVEAAGEHALVPLIGGENIVSANCRWADVYMHIPPYMKVVVEVRWGNRSIVTYADFTGGGQLAWPGLVEEAAGAGQSLLGTPPRYITGSEVLAATLSDEHIAAGNKDGTAGTPSLRTLGTGALQAAAGNDSRFSSIVPIGGMLPYSGDGDPPETNFLCCDGRLISTTTYAAYFARVGHKYNGGADPGGGQFRIPDKRGRTSVGEDDMGTARGAAGRLPNSNRVHGQSGGEERHVNTVTEMPAHSHTVNSHNHGGGNHSHGPGAGTFFVESGVANVGAGTGFDWGLVATTAASGTIISSESPGTNSQGGGVASNVMQPYEVDNWIVRVL